MHGKTTNGFGTLAAKLRCLTTGHLWERSAFTESGVSSRKRPLSILPCAEEQIPFPRPNRFHNREPFTPPPPLAAAPR